MTTTYTVPQMLRMIVADKLVHLVVNLYPRGLEKASLARALKGHYTKSLAAVTDGPAAMARAQEPMAYIATDPNTANTYAICGAAPSYIADTVETLQEWINDNALIELLPIEEAKQRFIACLGKNKSA